MAQIKEIQIPYDYEIIVIYTNSEMTYTLTEVYTIRGQFFSSNFGIWESNKDFGLKTSNTSFYQRRSNCRKAEVWILIQEEDDLVRFVSDLNLSW